MKRKVPLLVPGIILLAFIFLMPACKPRQPLLILHNSCSGYATLRNLNYPTPETRILLDSLGLNDSVGSKDSDFSYKVDSRIFIHPEDRIWLDALRKVFPEADVADTDSRGTVHVFLGINAFAFDSVPFGRSILVLNGTSKAGIARDAAYRFTARFGISALEPQSADADTFTKTVLYCSKSDKPLAEKIVAELGTGRVETRTNLADMILVLGTDAITASKVKAAPGGVSIVIKKSTFQLFVYKEGALVKTYAIATGRNAGDKERRGDCRTPLGDFTITAIQDSHTWEHDFGDGKGPIKGAYGPWFLLLSTLATETESGKAWEGIAVHGTHDPASIGTRASEGCIRLHNEDITELKQMVRVGTPVRIEE